MIAVLSAQTLAVGTSVSHVQLQKSW